MHLSRYGLQLNGIHWAQACVTPSLLKLKSHCKQQTNGFRKKREKEIANAPRTFHSHHNFAVCHCNGVYLSTLAGLCECDWFCVWIKLIWIYIDSFDVPIYGLEKSSPALKVTSAFAFGDGNGNGFTLLLNSSCSLWGWKFMFDRYLLWANNLALYNESRDNDFHRRHFFSRRFFSFFLILPHVKRVLHLGTVVNSIYACFNSLKFGVFCNFPNHHTNTQHNHFYWHLYNFCTIIYALNSTTRVLNVS